MRSLVCVDSWFAVGVCVVSCVWIRGLLCVVAVGGCVVVVVCCAWLLPPTAPQHLSKEDRRLLQCRVGRNYDSLVLKFPDL